MKNYQKVHMHISSICRTAYIVLMFNIVVLIIPFQHFPQVLLESNILSICQSILTREFIKVFTLCEGKSIFGHIFYLHQQALKVNTLSWWNVKMDLQLKQGGHSVVLYGNIRSHVTLISKWTPKCEIKVLLNVNLISEFMWYEWIFLISIGAVLFFIG